MDGIKGVPKKGDKPSAWLRVPLKIAENFQAFVGCPEHLAVLPVPILLRLCSKNYQVLIEKLQDIPIGGLTCKLVLGLIKERGKFLKSQKTEKKVGNWRATPDGSRYYTFGKIMEDDHQTGVLTDKLIEESGLSPQRIVRMAIANLYDNLQVEIPTDRISSLTDLINDEETDDNIDSEDVVNQINWESKQQEFESLLQKDTEDTDSEYPESEEESDIDLSEDVQSVAIPIRVSEESGTTLKLIRNQNQDDAASKDISKQVEMLLQATCWEEIVSTTENWNEELKSTVWKMLSEEERQSINQLKNQHFEKLEKIPQVGDKVIWNDCPVHLK
ncbi:hypothetical protein [Calothrix sp. CCY 0018]|uniref:hypothetical protein n=1 Tax=Calothrix sp. CCY 0018 TaxID=3103864 RepID=UPI0039C6F98B